MKAVHKELIVDAQPESVYAAWTTPEGITSFFGPACNVKLETNGPYEILFFPDAEEGFRGAEGCNVLAYQPSRMLSFTWSAPPQFPEIRRQRTAVIVRFHPIVGGGTRITLDHIGWGVGSDWDNVFEYFTKAWDVVLFRLKVRFDEGPIEWSNPPRPPANYPTGS
jgi:uncharacterized protein YndB with AHSA1/START domain